MSRHRRQQKKRARKTREKRIADYIRAYIAYARTLEEYSKAIEESHISTLMPLSAALGREPTIAEAVEALR